MSRDSGGDSGSIRWISLSAQIQKTEEEKKNSVGQIKMARIYVWEYVNKSPLYLFPLDFCSGVFFYAPSCHAPHIRALAGLTSY